MGSSSDKNNEARNKVPVDGLSPNCTICLSETPVAGYWLQLDGRRVSRMGKTHKGGIMGDGVHQLAAVFPRHGDYFAICYWCIIETLGVSSRVIIRVQ